MCSPHEQLFRTEHELEDAIQKLDEQQRHIQETIEGLRLQIEFSKRISEEYLGKLNYKPLWRQFAPNQNPFLFCGLLLIVAYLILSVYDDMVGLAQDLHNVRHSYRPRLQSKKGYRNRCRF